MDELLGAIRELNVDEAWEEPKDYLDLYPFISHFTDTPEQLLSILTSCELHSDHDYISFTGGSDLYRIAKRYKNHPEKYKYGIVLDINVLNDFPKNRIVLWHDFMSRLKGSKYFANGESYTRIAGIYDTDVPGLFILECFSYNFRTPVLIYNENLYSRLKERLDQMIEVNFNQRDHEIIINGPIPKDVQKLAEDNNLNIIESYRFKNEKCGLAFTGERSDDIWNRYYRIYTIVNSRKYSSLRDELKKVMDEDPDKDYLSRMKYLAISNQALIDAKNEWAERVEKVRKKIDNLLLRELPKLNPDKVRSFQYSLDQGLLGHLGKELGAVVQFYINPQENSSVEKLADIDTLAYSQLDEHEVRLIDTPAFKFNIKDVIEIVLQNNREESDDIKAILDIADKNNIDVIYLNK